MSQCEKCKHEIGKLTPSPQYNCYDCFDLVVKELAQLKNQLKREQYLVDRAYVFVNYNKDILSPIMIGWLDAVKEEKKGRETVKMRGN